MTGGRRGGGLLFVGGCPRSGTTLVQLMLDSHPNVCGGPEFDRIPDIVELRDRLRASVDSRRISVYCSKEDVDREVGALIERLLAPYAGRRNCELISEKTPWNVLMFEELLEIFPAARFIFCVRDPRAVVASMLGVGDRAKEKGQSSPGYTKNVYSAIRTIKITNAAGFEAASRSERVLTVAYERLVAEPERETTRMCDFLGLQWSEEMSRPGEKYHDGEKTLDDVWYTDDMFYSNPDPGRTHRWKDRLTTDQRAVISMSFEDDENLRALGYELSGESLPATVRAVCRAKLEAYAGLRDASVRLASGPILGRVARKLVSLAGAARQRRYHQAL